jgi:hypothetical protein
MKHYAGIDVSLESSSVCVVDAEGRIVREDKVASEPEALIAWFASLGLELERIGLEAGPLSQWLHAAMAKAGLGRLAAAVLVAVRTAAYAEGLQRFEADAEANEARDVFIVLIDRGLNGLAAALSGTPYVDAPRASFQGPVVAHSRRHERRCARPGGADSGHLPRNAGLRRRKRTLRATASELIPVMTR